jgi:predicted nucleic acid-binding protein
MSIDKVNNDFIQNKIQKTTEELKNYGEKHKLRGLEGRIIRGLDPAGLLAVDETRKKVEYINRIFGGKIEDLEKFTNEMHVGGIWDNTCKLANENDPEAKTWLTMVQATDANRQVSGDLSEEEFVADLKRVNINLTKASCNPEEFCRVAREKTLEGIEGIYGGIPYSNRDTGFVSMAVAGYTAGVVEDDKGLLFVGSKNLDFEILEKKHNLSKTTREDRGRMVEFYQNEDGEDVVKKLYPGLAIVFDGRDSLARDLAATGMVKNIIKTTTREEIESRDIDEINKYIGKILIVPRGTVRVKEIKYVDDSKENVEVKMVGLDDQGNEVYTESQVYSLQLLEMLF